LHTTIRSIFDRFGVRATDAEIDTSIQVIRQAFQAHDPQACNPESKSEAPETSALKLEIRIDNVEMIPGCDYVVYHPSYVGPRISRLIDFNIGYREDCKIESLYFKNVNIRGGVDDGFIVTTQQLLEGRAHVDPSYFPVRNAQKISVRYA
jgi:hypothetical protein